MQTRERRTRQIWYDMTEASKPGLPWPGLGREGRGERLAGKREKGPKWLVCQLMARMHVYVWMIPDNNNDSPHKQSINPPSCFCCVRDEGRGSLSLSHSRSLCECLCICSGVQPFLRGRHIHWRSTLASLSSIPIPCPWSPCPPLPAVFLAHVPLALPSWPWTFFPSLPLPPSFFVLLHVVVVLVLVRHVVAKGERSGSSTDWFKNRCGLMDRCSDTFGWNVEFVDVCLDSSFLLGP